MNYINTSFIPNIQISTAPVISEAEAEQIAAKHMRTSYAECENLVIYTRNIPEPKLAWVVWADFYNVYVNAATGEVIHKITTVRSAIG